MLLALVVIDAIIASRARPRAPRTPAIPADADPLRAIRTLAARAGGGVWLGAGEDGQWRFARPERAVLLLGPPRSGKTSGVIIPAVLAHAGPAVVTSTKPDVARATARARARDGRVWVFDPTGASSPPAGLEQLRWSPVTSALTWDGAVVIARAMTVTVGTGTTDRSHWANRAQALLAPLLHAAAVHGKEMETVVDWVMRHELDEPGILLEDQRASRLAFGSLLGLLNTEDRERSSIFSAAADALQAYTSEGALMTASDPNFDPAAFIAGRRHRLHLRAGRGAGRRRPGRLRPPGGDSAGDLPGARRRPARPAGCCSRWTRSRTSRRCRSCRRSPPRAAGRASPSSPRSRTSPRRALAGARPPTGS